MNGEWDIESIKERIGKHYESIFVNNFLPYVMKQEKRIGTEELISFAQAAHSVVLTVDYMLQIKNAVDKGSQKYLLLRDISLDQNLSIQSNNLYPRTKLEKIGFDNIDKGALAGFLNEKLEVTESSDNQIYGVEMRKIKTIDQCTQLFYNRYKKVILDMSFSL